MVTLEPTAASEEATITALPTAPDAGQTSKAGKGKGKAGKVKRPTLADWDAAQRERLAQYVSGLAVALRLVDWDIEIAWTKYADKTTDAEISPAYGRQFAKMYLSRTFPRLSLVEQRRVLVHELIHLHMHMFATLCAKGCEALETKPARRLFTGVLDAAEETVVDNMAMAVAELLALPDWDEVADPRPAKATTAPNAKAAGLAVEA